MNSKSSIFEHPSVVAHRQIYPMSCIPSAIEMILKWLNKVPKSYYERQDEWHYKWNDKKITFKDYEGCTYEEVEFKGRFLNYSISCPTFPYNDCFETIDNELAKCKCVLVMLPNSKNERHIWIIYDNKNGDYQAFTKEIVNNSKITHWWDVSRVYGTIREYINRARTGTHLLTYQV